MKNLMVVSNSPQEKLQDKGEFEENSQAVQSHLSIIQNIICRMSSNSSSSKAWCITIVSAVLVIVADKSKPEYAWIALFPTILFMFLDAYYLYLEKGFRNSYNLFIEKLHSKNLDKHDLFVVEPKGQFFWLYLKSLGSFSVWFFYLMLFILIFIAKNFMLAEVLTK
jgi:hypothetical protein